MTLNALFWACEAQSDRLHGSLADPQEQTWDVCLDRFFADPLDSDDEHRAARTRCCPIQEESASMSSGHVRRAGSRAAQTFEC